MSMALKEAHRALAINEVPVGAVLIDKKNQVIARGYNKVLSSGDLTAHAEIQILRVGSLNLGAYKLSQTVLYVTMEPCIMCMGAIIHSRISTLVFGTSNLNWGAAGSIYNFALDFRFNHKIKVIKGVCFEECTSLIKNFFQNKRL